MSSNATSADASSYTPFFLFSPLLSSPLLCSLLISPQFLSVKRNESRKERRGDGRWKRQEADLRLRLRLLAGTEDDPVNRLTAVNRTTFATATRQATRERAEIMSAVYHMTQGAALHPLPLSSSIGQRPGGERRRNTHTHSKKK